MLDGARGMFGLKRGCEALGHYLMSLAAIFFSLVGYLGSVRSAVKRVLKFPYFQCISDCGGRSRIELVIKNHSQGPQPVMSEVSLQWQVQICSDSCHAAWGMRIWEMAGAIDVYSYYRLS